jgi:superfamily II DNA or RNA helicase
VSSKFFTNEAENSLLNKFAGVFAANKDIARFDALVGYLRSSGYFSVRPHLEKVPKIRILVGINVDEIVESYHRKGHLFLADAGAAIDKFRKALSDDIAQAGYSRQIEEGIRQFVEDVVDGRLEIKTHPTRNLHAKIYLFLPEGFSEHKPGAVITGSSNLTDAGLGTKDRASNYEFNVLLHDFDDVRFASGEFNRLWEEGVSILPKEIREIQEKSHLRDDITPFQLYIKLLTEYFGPAIEYDPNSEADLPEGFLRLAYQMDAVAQGFLMLKKHRGFFLSDVVGLGKTIIATLVAKKFFYHNDFPAHITSTLIVVPPALKENWERYVRQFELKETHIVTCGSLHKVRNPEKYDLVIVDEAHKFRTDSAQSYEALQKLCKTPTRHRLADGSLAEKRVILVSATPLNNRPLDIRNQLLLFQDGKDSTLEVANLQRFFHRLQKEYEQALKNKDKAAGMHHVKRIYDEIRTRVLEEITIRRTRTDLEKTEDYKADLDRQGIRFPKVEAPHKIFYRLDKPTEALYDDTVQALSSRLTYNRYRAISHLVPALRSRYANADLVSTQLARIMRTMLLKRLDSSFHAFRHSLVRFRDATDAMVRMFHKGPVYIAPEENVTEAILDGKEEELLDRLTTLALTDPKVLICNPADFDPAFLPALESDFAVLNDLVARWEAVTTDPKLDEFICRLREELLAPALNPSGKLVIFSEAKDTTDYLAEKLAEAGFKKLVSVSAANRKSVMPVLRANFDANAPAAEKADDLDIIISTEVLAEGVNLHRANIVVNYDTPWNSTRLMQRLGRVNRIGSTAPLVHIYNFFPTTNVNDVIALEQRALLKLQAFHSALGEDSQIYSPEEEPGTFGLFEKSPEDERDERLEFLDELRRFRRENPGDFRIIKNLPLRARVGRHDRDRADSTIAYVRNARRDAFYRIASGEDASPALEELGFVEAARIFRAGVKEKAGDLPTHHHDHVLAAIETFREQLSSEAVQESTSLHQIGPNERRAMELLAALQSLPPSLEGLLSSEDRELLKAGTDAIRAARFDPMRRHLVKLVNAHRKTPLAIPSLLDQALDILRAFPLRTESDPAREQRFAGLAYRQLVPEIILSESFTP